MTKTSDLIIDPSEQGTEEWFNARLGIPSASQGKRILTTKGVPSKSANDYIVELAGEIISGSREKLFQSTEMKRGNELESEARDFFELETGHMVTQVGCVYKDSRKDRSCSPDGLIGDDGGLEIKCPFLKEHNETLEKGIFPMKHFHQVQFSMYITGRQWWYFLSYYPGMKPLIVRVERDVNFCAALGVELDKFIINLGKKVEFLRF